MNQEEEIRIPISFLVPKMDPKLSDQMNNVFDRFHRESEILFEQSKTSPSSDIIFRLLYIHTVLILFVPANITPN